MEIILIQEKRDGKERWKRESSQGEENIEKKRKEESNQV
jgi:hypothetical protein